MRALEDLKKILEHEVEKVSKKSDISLQEVEAMYKVVDILKDIETIEAMQDYGEEEEYSNRGYSRRGYAYDDDMSYRRGRDSRTGRYVSRDGGYYRGGSYRGYSMDEAKDHMMQKLEEAMNGATNERERQAIMQCMDKLGM